MTQKTLTLEHPGSHGFNEAQFPKALAEAVAADSDVSEEYVVVRAVSVSGENTRVTVEFGDPEVVAEKLEQAEGGSNKTEEVKVGPTEVKAAKKASAPVLSKS